MPVPCMWCQVLFPADDVDSLSLKASTGDVYIESVFTHCKFEMSSKANVVRSPVRLAGVDIVKFFLKFTQV